MRLLIFVALPLILSCNGIKVPIDRSEEVAEDEVPVKENPTQITPTYYVNDEDAANIDSYLIPPNPYQQEAVLSDLGTPATYLLPPTQEKQQDFYYNPAEHEAQTDWYPIGQAAPVQTPAKYQNLNQSDIAPLQEHTRRSKSHESSAVPVPATGLEPPLVDAPNDYFIPPSAEEIPIFQKPINVPRHNPKLIPLEEIQRPIIVPNQPRHELPLLPKKEYPLIYRPKLKESTLALHLLPPQPANYKIPTKLYPKKFGGEFKPVPIPIAQYLDDSALEIPRAKPAKLFKPLPSTEIDYLAPTDEKINYLYRKAENKRKLKGDELSREPPLIPEVSAEETYSKYSRPASSEQEASESINRLPGRNAYPAPLRQPSPAPQHDSAAPAPDERTEFRMHGMKGPHSYQFGFDTGKGKNRQFRFEERDNDGKVQGHYGYMDKHGKLRVVNYSADPQTGFHAEAPADKE